MTPDRGTQCPEAPYPPVLGSDDSRQDKATHGSKILPESLLVVLVALIVGVLYADVVAAMAAVWWHDPGYSHGLLIPPLAAYIAWSQRAGILATPARPDARGLWITALACLALVVGKLGAEHFLMRVSLVVLTVGLVWTFWGPRRLRRLAFPLFLLLTAVPLPAIVYNRVAAPLQLFASSAATTLLQSLQIPVYQEGNVIHMAHARLGIAEACSGLRSMSSLSVLALMMGYLQCSRLRTRAALLLLAIPTAITVNVGRIVGTALVAEHDPRLAEGFYHSFSGWLVFLVGVVVLVMLAKGLNTVFGCRQTVAGNSLA